MEQYLAEAIPGISKSPVELKGYFSAWVDLQDSENRIQITLIMNFPKKALVTFMREYLGKSILNRSVA